MGDKNILICLERLDIGGVETAVFNQAMALKQLGHQVVILAKHGIYTEVLQEKGIKCIDFVFDLGNNFDLGKAQQIMEVMRENKIEEVHINQYPCILSVLPACMIAKVPYVAYAHVNVSGVYEWFENTFDMYEDLFAFYFKQANKIVAITEEAKEEIVTRYSVAEDKFVIKNNSMYFEGIAQENKSIEEVKKFLMVSRLSQEKETSLKNGIDLFLTYAKKHTDAKLTIIGDGKIREQIEQYIGKNEAIEMVGAKNNVLDYIKQHDVVIGLDRCMLETIAMKRIAIVSGYTKLRGIITEQNIEEATKKNFSGRNLKSVSKEELVEQLENLTREEIREITEANYQYAYTNLNIMNNLYLLKEEEKVEKNEGAWELLTRIQEKRSALKEEKFKIVEESQAGQRQQSEKIRQQEEQIRQDREVLQQKEERIQALEQELSEVYQSKRWRYTDKISKFFS